MAEDVADNSSGKPDTANAPPVDTQPPAAPGSSGPRRRVSLPSIAWLAVVCSALLGIVFMQVQMGLVDYAWANGWTLFLMIVVVVALILRVFGWRDVHWVVRWLPIGVVAVIVLAGSSLVRVDRVSGRMVPKFVWRWAPKPDQLLGAPVIARGAPVDLKSTTPEDFPQFLGPGRNLVLTGIALERDWAAHPPRALWRQSVGAAWSGFSAVNGFAVTMEQRGEEELVTCYEVLTGKLRWAHAVAARHETVAGGVGPRCTPTIDDGLVYALGATGILRCLDGRTGDLVWSDDLLQRCGVTPDADLRAVAWGRSASPLVVDNLLVVPLGGPKGGSCASLGAYDKHTGELLWTGGPWQISYASPSLARLCGVPQILSVNEATVSGHRLEDGAVLWSRAWPGGSAGNATVPQAVVVSDNRVLLSKGYGVKATLIELAVSPDGDWHLTTVWEKRVLNTKFTNVAVRDGFAYGLSDGILECVEVETGGRRWRDRRGDYGPGQILLVDDLILVQAECGDVALVEANADRFVELARLPALADQTWNNLCLYGRYLLVRNSVEAACFELPLRD